MVDMSKWSQCMKELHREDPSLTEAELREQCETQDIDKTFNKSGSDFEGLLEMMGMMGLMLGATTAFNGLSDHDKTDVMGEGTFQGIDITETPIGEDIIQVEMTLPEPIPAEAFNELFDPDQIAQMQQVMEDYKQYGRMLDPKSVEYKEWQNLQNIMEQMGQFGYHETSVQSELTVYTQYEVMIPWTTCEDNDTCSSEGPVCEDCDSLAGELYLPSDFPEPPHYGCRCNEPMAEPEYVGGDSWQSFS
jgi:hypothetical protein